MMDEVTKDLLEALRDLIDSHWLHDSHAVDFDGTVLFSPSYEFSNLHCHRRSELRMDGFECVVWPGWYPDFKWSAYSTYEGSLWFEQFDSEAEARAVCMKLLADVMPEHSVSKAMAAIARAEAAMAEPQPDADGAWKASVIDQLIIAHILTAEHANDPLKAVQDLLAFESEIAIDPRVSKAAARLVEQARAEEREACAKVCESQRDAFNENLQVWQENPTLTPCDEFISDWDSEAKIGEQYAAAIRARGNK